MSIEIVNEEFRSILVGWRESKGIRNQPDMAAALKVQLVQVNSWMKAKNLPARKYWPRLIAAGVCTKEKLKDLAARRAAAKPKMYSLRGMRIYPLSEYAARAS